MARKKAAAHHGGAWKVAYADFVTAMMALFMVLWICSQDKEILIATSRYFQSPFKSPLDAKSGVLKFDSNKPANSKSSSDKTGGESAASTDAKSIDLQYLNSVAKDLFRMLNLDESLADKPVDVQVTSDGLRVTLFDRASKPLFEGDSARFSPWGDFVLQSLAWMIDRHTFSVVIEGHTRRGLDVAQPDYTAWELSADRANAARRLLTHYAVADRLIERVTGYADTHPLPLSPPESDSNQRVTLSLRVGHNPANKPSGKTPAPVDEKTPSASGLLDAAELTVAQPPVAGGPAPAPAAPASPVVPTPRPVPSATDPAIPKPPLAATAANSTPSSLTVASTPKPLLTPAP